GGEGGVGGLGGARRGGRAAPRRGARDVRGPGCYAVAGAGGAPFGDGGGNRVTCPSCGTENRAEARFCLNCGAELARVCPNGHPVPREAKFCDVCGETLGSDPQVEPHRAAEAPAVTAERRLVSVLFAHLVGFTTRSEEQDPGAARRRPSRCFRRRA